MKGKPDENKLTSYLLGELPEAEAAEFEYAVSSDAALRLAVEEMEKFQGGLSDVLGGGGEKLLPRHKAAIMKAAREAARGGKMEMLKSHKQSKMIYFWPVAAAAVVGIGVFVVTILDAPKGGVGSSSAASGTKDEKENVPSIDELTDGSLAMITKAVRLEKRMPVGKEVKLGELLESYPLQFNKLVSLKSGSSLGVEIVQCPWKPSWSLVFVSVKGVRDSETKISLRYEAVEGRNVSSGIDDRAEFVEWSENFAGNENLVRMFLVDGSGGELGTVRWEVNGESAPSVVLKGDDDSDISADGRFARLICGYVLWLQKSEKYMDAELVLGLAREAKVGNEVADRYDFLDLVDQSIKLSGE